MTDLVDLDPAARELCPCGLDVVDDEVQPPRLTGLGVGDPDAEGDRASGSRRRQLDDAEAVAGPMVDVEVEAGLLVERLRAIDVRHRDEHELELVVHVTSFGVSIDCRRTATLYNEASAELLDAGRERLGDSDGMALVAEAHRVEAVLLAAGAVLVLR